ncbi:class I SAM-dependent methyltransferase [Desulforamulus ruminis]|uniref:Methyltransferase type 11 n=1 Tax=Desulforamulus ruminis (strain ATCC 23193 / DSM 2154 / NCIMB 8452 / DL) TaxID=696281 RepID=F6DK90_DESRL|nr:class I SAM-dependent methyltransferase [Desulforamulus ruminis]AEG61507.1 Methyltransferase type 11 [Desulforamulus ruminis DSM 2154]
MSHHWDSHFYDHKHNFVSEYGSELIDLLRPQKNERILDLGCGTGDLANKITHSGAEVIGIDASENMIHKAKEKYPNIEFKVMDAVNLHLNGNFDGVFSNATLHWIKESQRLLAQVYSVLKPKGRFVAEFGGKDNVKTVTDAIITSIREAGYSFADQDFPWYFPTIGEYTSLMEQTGFTVTYATYFARPTKLVDDKDGIKDWIHMFGNNLLAVVPAEVRGDIIGKVEKKLYQRQFINGHWYADYKRIRVMGLKE